MDPLLLPFPVGINLTAASHVFLLEPCLNPALEEQAVGRAWRMGQTRPVVVKRLCVKVRGECSVCSNRYNWRVWCLLVG